MTFSFLRTGRTPNWASIFSEKTEIRFWAESDEGNDGVRGRRGKKKKFGLPV